MQGMSDTAAPLRLLIATPLYPPEPGGPATYAKLLEEGLPGRGIEVSVVKFSDVRGYVKVVRHVVYGWRLFRLARRHDLVLALDPVSVGLPAAVAALLSRTPFVVKVVGDYAWEQGRQRFGIRESLDEFVRTRRVPRSVAFLRFVQRWVAGRAKVVIVPSEYLKRIVQCWGVPEGKFAVVHNAVEFTKGGKVPEEVAALPAPLVVSVGRLVPWKGMQGLIDAVAAVRKAGVSLSLVIVGNGPIRGSLESHAGRVLKGDCVFTGALAPTEVHAVLARADIFALNTAYEGLSHVLIEALMAGLPIVTTDVGGNSEVLPESAGVLVEPGNEKGFIDALGRLAEDKGLRARYAQAALARAAAFSPDAMLSRTQAVLEAVHSQRA